MICFQLALLCAASKSHRLCQHWFYLWHTRSKHNHTHTQPHTLTHTLRSIINIDFGEIISTCEMWQAKALVSTQCHLQSYPATGLRDCTDRILQGSARMCACVRVMSEYLCMPCKSQSQCALSDNANLGLQMQKADRDRKMRVRKGGEETGREKEGERGRGKWKIWSKTWQWKS